MYAPRSIRNAQTPSDSDGLKLYTISVRDTPVDETAFHEEMRRLKGQCEVDWAHTAAFAIFHEGESARYLVLAWWGNGNELFTRVSVRASAVWVCEANRYSFCLWDMEVMWFERQSFIRHLYSGDPSLANYRKDRIPEVAARAQTFRG